MSAARTFMIVSHAFGCPIYMGVNDISDNKADGAVFVEGEDNGALKARYASTLYGYTFEVEYQ